MTCYRKITILILCTLFTWIDISYAYESTSLKNYKVITNKEQNKHQLLHQYHDAVLAQTPNSISLNLSLTDVKNLKKLGYRVLEVSDKHLRPNKVATFVEKLNTAKSTAVNKAKKTTNPQLSPPEASSGIEGFSCYSTVEETYAAAANLAENNPSFVQWKTIGQSWEKANAEGGYDLKVLVLGADVERPDKPKLFIHSAMHAREYTTAALTLDFAKYLTNNQTLNADVNWILNEHEIHILFMMNPDGRKQAEKGLYWRKNTSQFYCGVDSEQRGVDLNRNFTNQWNSAERGSSGEECASTFRGPEPASEPETQAVEAYVRSLFADNRGEQDSDAAPENTSGLHLDLHSAGGMVIWPWGNTTEVPPNGIALQTLGRKFAAFNGYAAFQSVGLYPTDGTSDNVSYGELGVAAFAFEMGSAFFEECEIYQQEVLPNNLEALIYAAKTVEAPYLKPKGPDLINFRLEGAGSEAVVPGTMVTIKATASDNYFAYNKWNPEDPLEVTQSIQKVEYSIGVYPSAEKAIIIQLEPFDGVFDTSIEEVSAILDTKSLEKGQYSIYARAQDSDGNWGVMSSLILEIDPDVVEINTPPSAEFSYLCDDLLCQFDASESIDAQGIASYKWRIDGGAPLHGKVVYFPYLLTAEYKIELEVVDTHGLIITSEQTIAVEGLIEPVAAFEVVCEGLVCLFDSSTSSDEDGEIILTTWVINGAYFDQNPPETTFEYTFEAAGEYVVSLEIFDNDHIYNAIQKTINVKAPDPVVPTVPTVPTVEEPINKNSGGGAIIWLSLMLIISVFLRVSDNTKYLR